MDWSDLGANLRQIWQERPRVLVVLAFVLVFFLYLVFDAWRHKRHRRHQHHHREEL